MTFKPLLLNLLQYFTHNNDVFEEYLTQFFFIFTLFGLFTRVGVAQTWRFTRPIMLRKMAPTALT